MLEFSNELLIALTTSFISVGISVFSLIKSNHYKTKLTYLEHNLEIRKSTVDARRDYEYEARKRLYHECEPILFLSAELAESAFLRIHDLAFFSRKGLIKETGEGILNEIGYYSTVTMYRIIAPLATYKLLRDKLTSVDLELDERIKNQYILLKTLYFTFADDSRLAEYSPSIEYDHYDNKSEKQGIRRGEIDNMVDSLIIENSQGKYSVMDFGNFQKCFFTDDKNILNVETSPFAKFYDLIKDFHPKRKPVLWRIFLAQSYLNYAIMNLHHRNNFNKIKIIKNFPLHEKKKLEWLHEVNNSEGNNTNALLAVENYLASKLPEFI